MLGKAKEQVNAEAGIAIGGGKFLHPRFRGPRGVRGEVGQREGGRGGKCGSSNSQKVKTPDWRQPSTS
jgi:hypothetical protein